jgi:hypothetical protein
MRKLDAARKVGNLVAIGPAVGATREAKTDTAQSMEVTVN